MINEFRGDFRFLSNFYQCRLRWIGHDWYALENAYQATKAQFSTGEIIPPAEFLHCTPGQAKRKTAKMKLAPHWHDRKLGVMENLLRRKFAGRDLASKLLATEGHELVEGNRWGDCYWGVDLRTGKGDNNLGKLLMLLRQEIIDQSNEEIIRDLCLMERAGFFGK